MERFPSIAKRAAARLDPAARMPGRAAFHPGCHLLRELEVTAAPQKLLNAVDGLEVRPLANAETCCGFGGSFSVKLPHISEGMLHDKVAAVLDSGADTLVSCDMSCLMHLGGALRRRNPAIRALHLAQVLDAPAESAQPPAGEQPGA